MDNWNDSVRVVLVVYDSILVVQLQTAEKRYIIEIHLHHELDNNRQILNEQSIHTHTIFFLKCDCSLYTGVFAILYLYHTKLYVHHVVILQASELTAKIGGVSAAFIGVGFITIAELIELLVLLLTHKTCRYQREDVKKTDSNSRIGAL